MDHDTRTQLGARLAHYVATGTTYDAGTAITVPTSHYRDAARWRSCCQRAASR